MKLLIPADWNAFEKEPAGVRQGVGSHRRRAALRRPWRRCRGGVLRPRFNWQALITLAVLLVVGFLVLLPLVFLVEESLNIGDPMAFPPEAVRHRQLHRDLRGGPQRPHQHGDHRRDGHGDGHPDRLHAGLDPDAHQRAGPREARAADGAALLHDAAGRRARLGGDRRAPRAASSTRSGTGRAARGDLFDIYSISASPGSWRCSRARSPSS